MREGEREREKAILKFRKRFLTWSAGPICARDAAESPNERREQLGFQHGIPSRADPGRARESSVTERGWCVCLPRRYKSEPAAEKRCSHY